MPSLSLKVDVLVAQYLAICVGAGGTLRGEVYLEVFVLPILLSEGNSGLLE